jgi:acyl-[acyl-carrier-protein]-phospholipid O-acyltransferase/long-chain-fatty-acid--[acyl-carrier-protein] ligase
MPLGGRVGERAGAVKKQREGPDVQQSQFHLLKSRRFLPLFATQFLGAFNDNTYRQALVILVTYGMIEIAGNDPRVLITAAAGVFILPFFLFSAIAGQLADKLEKSRLILFVKIMEIVVMGLAAAGFLIGNVWLLMTVLFLMGAQSAFFGPLKYSVLPDHLRENELVGGNALIETGTFLAILLGTVFGGLMVRADGGLPLVAGTVVVIAVAGVAASFFIPKAGPAAPDLKLNLNIVGESWSIVRHAAANRMVFRSIIGISWFWAVGTIFLAQFPTFGLDIFGADESVVTLFLVAFSLGIGLGSMQCNRWLKGEVSARYVPLGAVGMALVGFDLYAAASQIPAPTGEALIGITAFFSSWPNIRVFADLVFIAIFGGFFIVPLYAIMQARSDEENRSRTIAANNIVNAGFIVAASAASAAMLWYSFTVVQVFLALAIGNTLAAIYVVSLLPDEVVKGIGRWLFRMLYGMTVEGEENLRKCGDRVVIVANHTSFLDGALLSCFLPQRATFAVNTHIAKRWWIKPAFLLFDLLPLDPTNPMAAKTMVSVVKQGRPLVIFPEGRITVTGALMKIYEGPGTIADLAGATILPVRIAGAQYTPFSRLKGKLRLRWFPTITMTIQEPRRIEVDPALKGRRRREAVAQWLYDVMTETIFQTGYRPQTLFAALLDARTVNGSNAPIVEDVQRKPLSYNGLVTGSLVLGRRLARLIGPGKRLGLMLPNGSATVTAFFGLQAFGRVPAMLNFSAGVGPMLAACGAAEVTRVVTSRRFVEMAGLEELVTALGREVEILHLEDIAARIGPLDKLRGLLSRPFAAAIHRRAMGAGGPDSPAVVLFTSGSEGLPKGVVLSHANLDANRQQLSACIDFNPSDTVFNALPIFHSFGLTGGTLLPILSGVRTFMYPSPLHYRIVPELVYDTNATILFGTDTFLTGYARSAHPYDFYSVRYVFAGAEKVKDETRRVWGERFGVRIFEGYGATETAPALSTNTPMHYRAGTVGRLLPGIEHRLVPVPGIDEGGRLEVSGPNVMLGYFKVDNPGVLEPPEGGWYDTGDIVTFDEDGFISIRGRAKRFAKIAGEMVSLTAVEGYAAATWPDNAHAVVAVPDERKGEQLVLVTDHADATREAILAQIQAQGGPELACPRNIMVVEEVPMLGSGKTDYPAVQGLVG